MNTLLPENQILYGKYVRLAVDDLRKSGLCDISRRLDTYNRTCVQYGNLGRIPGQLVSSQQFVDDVNHVNDMLKICDQINQLLEECDIIEEESEDD